MTPPTNLSDEQILAMLEAAGPRAKVIRYIILKATAEGYILRSYEAIAREIGGEVTRKIVRTVIGDLRRAEICKIVKKCGIYQIVPLVGTERSHGSDN